MRPEDTTLAAGEVEPTPTCLPWIANGTRVESKDGHGWENDGWIVCECMGPDAFANAQAIATACNAYDDLLAALRDCMECMDSLRDFVSEGGSRHMVGATEAIIAADDAYDQARAAIANSEEVPCKA